MAQVDSSGGKQAITAEAIIFTPSCGKPLVPPPLDSVLNISARPEAPHSDTACGGAGSPAVLLATDPALQDPSFFDRKRVLIVGAGMTGAQAATRAASVGAVEVTLLSRSSFRVSEHSADPVWLGRHFESAFRQASPAERFKLVQKSRGGGSIDSASLLALSEWANVGGGKGVRVLEGCRIDSVESTGGKSVVRISAVDGTPCREVLLKGTHVNREKIDPPQVSLTFKRTEAHRTCMRRPMLHPSLSRPA